MKARVLVATVVVTISFAHWGATTAAAAHHSFAAQYDRDDPVGFEGVVTRVEWKNPHAHFYVDVTAPDGTVANWDMELASPNMLIRNGWKMNSIEEGDRVQVTGSRAKDGTSTAATTLITLPDGSQLTFIANPSAQ
jgi:hypothetical protein